MINLSIPLRDFHLLGRNTSQTQDAAGEAPTHLTEKLDIFAKHNEINDEEMQLKYLSKIQYF